MQVLVINGNTKKDGFIAGALAIVADRLAAKGVEVVHLRLAEARIQDCLGCFRCLKTGTCVIDDDMARITRQMLDADGFVVGSPVRNGLTTACYKRFYERITYTVGFPLLIEDKHTLAICSVGVAGGKAANKKLLGLQDVFRTRLSDFLFFRVGFPATRRPEDVRDRLEHAADRLMRNIESRAPKSLLARASAAIDRAVVRRFILRNSPEQFAFLIARWKEKGYIRGE